MKRVALQPAVDDCEGSEGRTSRRASGGLAAIIPTQGQDWGRWSNGEQQCVDRAPRTRARGRFAPFGCTCRAPQRPRTPISRSCQYGDTVGRSSTGGQLGWRPPRFYPVLGVSISIPGRTADWDARNGGCSGLEALRGPSRGAKASRLALRSGKTWRRTTREQK